MCFTKDLFLKNNDMKLLRSSLASQIKYAIKAIQ